MRIGHIEDADLAYDECEEDSLVYDDTLEEEEQDSVHCQLVSKWADKIKDVPDGTPLDEILGAEELRTDVKRFEYFCRKFFGYEQYPKDHPQEYQFHYIGDSE